MGELQELDLCRYLSDVDMACLCAEGEICGWPGALSGVWLCNYGCPVKHEFQVVCDNAKDVSLCAVGADLHVRLFFRGSDAIFCRLGMYISETKYDLKCFCLRRGPFCWPSRAVGASSCFGPLACPCLLTKSPTLVSALQDL